MQTSSYLIAPYSRSTKTLSRHVPRPFMLMASPALFRRSVNAVNVYRDSLIQVENLWVTVAREGFFDRLNSEPAVH